MKWRYCIKIILISILFLSGCEKSLNEQEQMDMNSKNPNEMSIRFRSVAGALANVNLYAFQVTSPGDTVCHSVLPQVTAAALANPVKLTLPMGEYVLVALGNVDSRIVMPTPGVTKLHHMMATLVADATNPGFYEQAGEWFWGINTSVKIGEEATDIITLKRLVGKVVVTYKHADPFLTRLQWSVDGLAPKSYLNASFDSVHNAGISVIRDLIPAAGNVTVDSMLALPTVNSSSTLHLTHTRTINGTASSKNYQNLLTTSIQSNYITRITINGGESTGMTVTEQIWTRDTMMVILDESPNPSVSLDLGDFTASGNDTTYLQSVDVRVAVNLGVLTNYTGNFTFTITKTGTTPTSITKNVPMKVVNGKLVTKTPVKLSRGSYTLTAYKLNDTEGVLPDPAAKAVTKNFTVALDYQIIDVTLDGRQAVDNALLKLTVNGLHGTGQTDGSAFPGSSLYNTLPLGSTLPSSSDGLGYSYWYVNNNNYVQRIPVRGEWRVYSLVYRGSGIGAVKLNGILPTELGQLGQLTLIDFRVNSLTGALPTMASLKLLNNLILNNNSLSGNIDNLGVLTNLSRISLENNGFSGTITTGLGGSSSVLNYLSLNNNNFSGSVGVIQLWIPSVFIARNHFSGSIPAFNVAITSTAAQCDFRYNDFTCYMPGAGNTPSRINPQNSGTNIGVCP